MSVQTPDVSPDIRPQSRHPMSVQTPDVSPDTHPEGSVASPEGSVANPEGSVANPEGSVASSEGSGASSEGSGASLRGCGQNPGSGPKSLGYVAKKFNRVLATRAFRLHEMTVFGFYIFLTTFYPAMRFVEAK